MLRQHPIWIFLAAVLLTVGTSAMSHAAQRPPNFVFILIDDMGWKDIGCDGSHFYETPNIDSLAKRGMRFTQAYASCPVCSPTRASLLTGKYPARLHLTDWREPGLGCQARSGTTTPPRRNSSHLSAHQDIIRTRSSQKSARGIGAANTVVVDMGQLPFNRVRIPKAAFVEN